MIQTPPRSPTAVELAGAGDRSLSLVAVFIATALLPLAVLCAQPPPAAKPVPPPKRIPPPGITLTTAERDELTSGIAALRQELDSAGREVTAQHPEFGRRLADLEIFPKAVAWALADNAFFAPKEVAFARHLLAEGHERVAQLRAGSAPWVEASGLVVRGYRSKLDGSIQPYGLVVPPNWDRSKPGRLMVWLLGRGEKRTELAFLAEREAGPAQLTPANTLVLVPYGRFCNATKFAGEMDVFEAMEAVKRDYQIDPNRILVAGFSMGGGSTWHLAAHYSGLWCAASPGAGFAETPIFTKASAPGKEVRPEWEQLLWRQYECTGIAGNLFNCPTVAYSGEIDPQKEAADLMEAATAREGVKLERFIGPQTAHRYHPETKEALTRRLEQLLDQGRDPNPREVHLSTYTLRYPEAAWVRIEGLEKHWERADVVARVEPNGELTVTTKNVTALRITNRAPTWVIDGQRMPWESPMSAAAGVVIRDGPTWRRATADDLHPLHKRPGLTGPVDDAFMGAFLFVRPTGKPLNPEVGAWVESELTAACHLWHDVFRGEPIVKADRQLTDADITSHNLVLWGDPASNAVLKKILARLPLRWDAHELVFRGKTYNAANHAPVLIFPNPLNPSRYVVLNSGIDFRTDGYGNNALQTPKLPDWAIVDLREPPGPRWPGKIVAAGFFNEDWK